MPQFDRHFIGPFQTGLQTNLRPFLIMDDAFSTLENAYIWRGRLLKRFGGVWMGDQSSQFNSRLRVQIGSTDGSGSIAGNVRTITVNPTLPLKVGQIFTIGVEVFTVVNPAGGLQNMLDTGGAITAVFNISTGDFNITGADSINTAVYFYPGLPVMGLTVYQVGAINNEPTYAFDTNFAYVWTGAFWRRSGAAVWHTTNNDALNFFWTTNWEGIPVGQTIPTQNLFVTNFQVLNPNGATAASDDPIWWFDGTTWHAALGALGFYFLPNGGSRVASPFVQTAKIILPFKNRLLFLNTIENDNSAGGNSGTNTNFVNRCRFSFNGSPFAFNAWYEPNQVDAAGNVAAGAGYIDASTDEAIVSAEFIKDRLIVYFERSTWEIVYTGSEVTPFFWQKINTELGSMSTFSSVPFDKQILTIGNTGVHACSGANVIRIDEKIPDEIFTIQAENLNSTRVHGIRDFFTEVVYWTYVSNLENPLNKFPDKILLYNYQNNTWAINDDSITCFGYFEQQTDVLWQDLTSTWANNNQQWNSGVDEANSTDIIAGNQEGYVFIIKKDQSRNAAVLQITNITNNAIGTLTIIDHNLKTGDLILIENAQGVTDLNGRIFPVILVTKDIVGINTAFTGVYTGGGTATRVSEIDIWSKQWNPYINSDRNIFLQRIDFAVTKTQNGEITVDYFPSDTEVSMLNDGAGTGALIGNGVLQTSPYDPTLYPLEQFQERLWHPIYFQTTGNCIQIRIFFNEDQITNPAIALDDFEIQGFILYTMSTSFRMQ